MKTIKSCEFNMDTGCVELRFQDGSMISIDCTAVENEVADNLYEMLSGITDQVCGRAGSRQ